MPTISIHNVNPNTKSWPVIQAIKEIRALYRDEHRPGLREAKDYADSLLRQLGTRGSDGLLQRQSYVASAPLVLEVDYLPVEGTILEYEVIQETGALDKDSKALDLLLLLDGDIDKARQISHMFNLGLRLR